MAMTGRTKTPANQIATRRIDDGFDLDALLHPARAFAHPMAVVNDADLTLNEKRAILASWASDACAVEAAPELRQLVSGPIIRFEEIMDALKMLDEQAAASTKPVPHYRRILQNRNPGTFGRRRRGSGHGDTPLN
jgi:hypothetical protein